MEVWKSENVLNYPVQLEPNNPSESTTERQLRPGTSRKWNQDTKFAAAKESFSRNAAKLWNNAQLDIKNAKKQKRCKNSHLKLLQNITKLNVKHYLT